MYAITAHREKIEIIRDRWDTPDTGSREKWTLRSNRVVMPFSRRGQDERVVVRGKSLPGTLTMAVAVLKCYGRFGTVLGDLVVPVYMEDYQQNLSKFEKEHIPDNWVSVYVNGNIAYSTTDFPEVDYLEQQTKGESLTDDVLERAEEKFADGNRAVMLSHDSQVSMVVNSNEKNVKVAILERNVRHDGKFSFTIQNDGRKRKLLPALATASYICEASAMLSLYGRLKNQMENKEGKELLDLKRLIETTKELTYELRGRILSSNKMNNIQFWPEPPPFITSTITSYTANEQG